MSELKPCPFCGSPMESDHDRVAERVRCTGSRDKCPLVFGGVLMPRNLANRRAPSPEVDGLEVRPSLVRFVRMMEAQLKRNDHRGGWRNCKREYFTERMQDNFRDLFIHMQLGEREAVQRDCADLANFAMMLAENEYLAAYKEAQRHA